MGGCRGVLHAFCGAGVDGEGILISEYPVSSERLRSERRPLPFRGSLARIRVRGPCSSGGSSSRDDNGQYTAIRDGLTSVYESAANTTFWLSYALSRQGSIWIVAPKVAGLSRVGN